MRMLIVVVGVVAMVFFGSGMVAAQQNVTPPPQTSIEGSYLFEGTNHDGTAYTGLLEIVKTNEIYKVLWRSFDRRMNLGIGIRVGDAFAVSMYSVHGEAIGVVFYQIEGDRMVGEWTALGLDERTYKESLTKTSKTFEELKKESGLESEPPEPVQPAPGPKLPSGIAL